MTTKATARLQNALAGLLEACTDILKMRPVRWSIAAGIVGFLMSAGVLSTDMGRLAMGLAECPPTAEAPGDDSGEG